MWSLIILSSRVVSYLYKYWHLYSPNLSKKPRNKPVSGLFLYWRNRPLQGGKYPYVYVDDIYLRRNWDGEYENVAILVAIAVNEDGYQEVIGAAEGMKERPNTSAAWFTFIAMYSQLPLD